MRVQLMHWQTYRKYMLIIRIHLEEKESLIMKMINFM